MNINKRVHYRFADFLEYLKLKGGRNMKTIINQNDFLETYKIKAFGHRALNICKISKWIPLKPTPLLALIVAHLMGDGNLSKDRMVGDFRFYGSKINLNEIKKDLYKQFKLIPYLYYPHPEGNCYILRYNNAIFSRILELAGVPRGDKILSNFEVPKWIMQGSKNIKRSFLRTILANEMDKLGKSNGVFRGLDIRMSKCIDKLDNHIYFLSQIQKLLKEFSVTSSKIYIKRSQVFYRKDGNITYPVGFYLHRNRLNRKMFYLNVGFNDKTKQKLLYNSLKD